VVINVVEDIYKHSGRPIDLLHVSTSTFANTRSWVCCTSTSLLSLQKKYMSFYVFGYLEMICVEMHLGV